MFLGILNYISRISPMTAQVCELLCKLTLMKADWTCNKTYQDLYEIAKRIVKRDVCMKFCDATRPLYVEIDASSLALEPDCYKYVVT